MTDPNPPNREQDRAWDRTVDLLIIGSGAGAMTAGIVGSDRGAQVLLIEKGTRFGGSSAMSAGGLWVPCNPQSWSPRYAIELTSISCR
jgi:3-oxosteroid 1-dehydrogenase